MNNRVNKIKKAIVGGILGTAAMTLVIWSAPSFGMPSMSPPQMLSAMLGFSIMYGWVMHFMIGVTFALMYVLIINMILGKINSAILKGAIFGAFAFIFGQIMIAILGALFVEAPPVEGSVMSVMMESVLGHLVFGMVVAMYVKL